MHQYSLYCNHYTSYIEKLTTPLEVCFGYETPPYKDDLIII